MRFAILLFCLLAGQLRAADVIPEKFGSMRYRTINGKVYDFADAINWANAYYFYFRPDEKFLKSKPPDKLSRIGGMIGGSTPKPSREDEERDRNRKLVLSLLPKYESMLLFGRVHSVSTNGIILECDAPKNETVLKFLKNYPEQSKVVDGDSIVTLVVPDGNYSDGFYTMKSYDHGIPSKGRKQVMPEIKWIR